MKFILSIFIFFTAFYTLQAQDFNFKPVWKIGTEKKITRIFTDKKYENDSLIDDFETTEITLIKVIAETKENYNVEILKENFAIKLVKEFYPEIEAKLPKYKNLKLLYEVNKKTGEYKLLNWKEAKKLVEESLQKIEKVLEKTDYDGMGSLVSLSVNPYFINEESISEYMSQEIGFMFVPFSATFTLNDTISTTNSDKNPLNPTQNLSVYTHLMLEKVENNVATFKITKEMDMTEVLDMVKSMMLSMAKSMDIDEETREQKLKEIEDIEMAMTDEQSIVFDTESNWVTNVETIVKVSGSDPQNGKQLKITTYTARIE